MKSDALPSVSRNRSSARDRSMYTAPTVRFIAPAPHPAVLVAEEAVGPHRDDDDDADRHLLDRLRLSGARPRMCITITEQTRLSTILLMR